MSDGVIVATLFEYSGSISKKCRITNHESIILTVDNASQKIQEDANIEGVLMYENVRINMQNVMRKHFTCNCYYQPKNYWKVLGNNITTKQA